MPVNSIVYIASATRAASLSNRKKRVNGACVRKGPKRARIYFLYFIYFLLNATIDANVYFHTDTNVQCDRWLAAGGWSGRRLQKEHFLKWNGNWCVDICWCMDDGRVWLILCRIFAFVFFNTKMVNNNKPDWLVRWRRCRQSGEFMILCVHTPRARVCIVQQPLWRS